MTNLEANPETAKLSEAVELMQARSGEFNWVFFTVIATFHLGAIAALFCFYWSSLAILLAMWLVSQNVGIAISYHRQLTHRSFITPKWVEYAMAICGSMALQGSPIYWVAVHRMHHQFTDKPGDPHSPR
ncbi:MAG TPA: acyl-CoA desaturase, partial [Terracidiphilus sp.]